MHNEYVVNNLKFQFTQIEYLPRYLVWKHSLQKHRYRYLGTH